MWKVTALDYEAPLFANAEAREGVGADPVLFAKWRQRGLAEPNRPIKGGRGGQYAAKKIFELRVMNVVTQQTTIPVGEAHQIAELASSGPWSRAELTAQPTHWRSLVIRDRPPPIDVFLIFYRTEQCWAYDMLGVEAHFKNSASIVIAAARELRSVSKYCWNILEESGQASGGQKD